MHYYLTNNFRSLLFKDSRFFCLMKFSKNTKVKRLSTWNKRVTQTDKKLTRPGEHTCNLPIQEMEAGAPSSRTSLATQRLKPRLHESMSQTVTAKEGAD